jgi:hypothetical protein
MLESVIFSLEVSKQIVYKIGSAVYLSNEITYFIIKNIYLKYQKTFLNEISGENYFLGEKG